VTARTPRQLGDAAVEALCAYEPSYAEVFGLAPGNDAVPDYSPDAHQEFTGVLRRLSADLDAVAPAGSPLPPAEQRAARLLRERLGAFGALRLNSEVNNLGSPTQNVRMMLLLMPKETEEDWAVIGRRLHALPESMRGYRASLEKTLTDGPKAAPRQITTLVEQLTETAGWYGELVSAAPERMRAELDAGARATAEAMDGLKSFLADRYLPAVQDVPDGVGEERYLIGARYSNGADLDLADAYAYGWEEYHRLRTEMTAVAGKILPGATPRAAMDHLNKHGEAIEGEENIRVWLQEFMDRTITELNGTHFDLAERVQRVESMIAPPGGAAAPHYTPPSLDFSRPGRTWLPTMGETRFPIWWLVSTWYHEGVPGHHLQLAQWCHIADQLSTFQVTFGNVSASTEGWALYAERLADELGLLTDPAHRLGYLSEQMTRAVRVIIDIGMHLRMRIPAGADFHPGETWTPDLGTAFMAANTGMEPAYLESEITRYLGLPGQAISYKLGERAWLNGREAARTAHAARGEVFDLKSWHMKALSLGSLGLDDLTEELAVL
jgi:uncharacterized protein (DUF885 family)